MPTPAHRPPRRSGVFRGSERTKRSGTALTRVPDDYDEYAADHTKKADSSKSGSTERSPADDTPPCQHPMEALRDLRYRPDDTLCPICHGRLPRMSNLHEKEDTFMSAPPVWKVAPKGESWSRVGLHHEDLPPTCVRQRLDKQKLQPHDEANAAAHFELGVKLAREAASKGLSPSARAAALTQAAGWFRAAAFHRHPKATYQIAMCYLEGRGTRKDAREGVAFLRKAAYGDAEAAYELGQCYNSGTGVEQDPDQAATWWRKALELGHLHAQEALNSSAAAASSASQHAKTAQLRRMADAGDPEAQYQVGVRLMDGFAMTCDEAASARYYRMAALQDHAPAQCALALCYRHGAGVQADMQECLKWLNIAADAGHSIALAELGAMYEDGVGVTRDQERASQLLLQAEHAEKARLLEHCRHLAVPRRGRLTVKAKHIEPQLSYLRARLAHLQSCLAVSVLSRTLLSCTLRRRLRRNPPALLDVDLHEWARARAQTTALEHHLQSLFKPLCLLMGHEPHPIPAEEAAYLLQDVDSMMHHIKGGHSFERARGSAWDRAASKASASAEGNVHSKVATMADAAVHLYGEKQLEMEWEGDQVNSKDGLKPLAYVDFIVRYDRKKGAMYAVSLSPQLVGDAPLPGSILVLPRGPEPQQALLLAGRRKHALDSELKVIAAKHMTRLDEEDGGGFVELSQQEKQRRDLLLGRLARTNDEHALRKAQVFRHKDEWWQDLWSQSRARPISDNDALLAANLIADEQYQQVRGQVTEIEDGDPDAQLQLGYMYLVGEGTKKNPERAVHWFERSAIQGQVQAKCALGVCHAIGEGLPRENRAKARELFEEAAGMGFALAHTYLADMQRYGTGLERPDHRQMLDHIRSAVLSCAAPSVTFNRAGNRLGEIHSHAGILPGSTKFSMESEKKLVPRNDAKAFELFVAASKTPGLNAKFGRALTNLGEMFEYGRAPQSRRDAESEDAKSKWKEGCENKALELYEEARGSGGVVDERALSNLRAMPPHLSSMAGTAYNWEEYVDDVEKRLTRIFTEDD